MKKTFELYEVNLISFTSCICSFSFCSSEGSPEKQNRYVDIHEEIYYGNWPLWLWRLRSPPVCCLQAGEAGGIILCEFKALETRAVTVELPEPGGLRTRSSDVQGRKRWVSQLKRRENWPSVDWMMPAHIGKGDLYSVFRFRC